MGELAVLGGVNWMKCLQRKSSLSLRRLTPVLPAACMVNYIYMDFFMQNILYKISKAGIVLQT